MWLARLLLFPFSVLYGLVILLRNGLYKAGIFTRTTFDIPIICVGNISVGGTGKTPHIEWLIQHLHEKYKIAVLSRGYKRKTVGYVFAKTESTPNSIGDEPYQIHQKFQSIAVGVSENRVLGVPSLLMDAPETDVILMDDGFQHLAIQAGLNIILTSYQQLYVDDWLMPAGRLREFKSAADKAEIIIVTKCAPDMNNTEKSIVLSKLNLKAHQSVYFTAIRYSELKAVFDIDAYRELQPNVLAFSGIANHQLFVNELRNRFTNVHVWEMTDHQNYTVELATKLVKQFSLLKNTILVTTEKDSVKLRQSPIKEIVADLPLYYLPMEVFFLFGEEQKFTAQVTEYINKTLEAYNA